ncbi:hypothetical protein KPC_3344 [Acinetobacter stercoris]|uniref:Uncharacterized protein n=1 Tax=Acinetobacter stercoris TaxID=2126983 RepID=A0A2U3N3A7_9GAMM|nr:hypothetical protein KPC_3344 [Acinetobacter stercoris]
MNALDYRFAKSNDIPQLVSLIINSAYREDQGKSWTNESKIILGNRISEVQLYLELTKSDFFY